jgi:formate dehydrogenase maturation protein FdhE
MDEDDDDVWSTVCSMVSDRDLGVRKQVLHTLCDGSPDHREAQIIDAVESLSREADRDLRRMVNKVLANFHRTGEWNIM